MVRIRVVVSFELPYGATRQAAVDYVVDAVSSMKGCYHPEDPIFELDGDTVEGSTVITRNNKRIILRSGR